MTQTRTVDAQGRVVAEGPAREAARPSEAFTTVAIDAPAELHDLCGFLLRYRAAYAKLPDSLGELRRSGVMPVAETPARLDDYAYSAAGLGRLPDGRRVVLVDAAIRVAGHAWCVLEEVTGPRTTTLSVSLVPLGALDQAAAGGAAAR